jgi:hypothetical protein
VRLSALRPPLFGAGRDHKNQTRAQQRVAGSKKRMLFDIVNAVTANGSSTSREAARLNRLILRRMRSIRLEGWAATDGASCFETPR